MSGQNPGRTLFRRTDAPSLQGNPPSRSARANLGFLGPLAFLLILLAGPPVARARAASFVATPQTLTPGAITITLSGWTIPSKPIVTVDGKTFTTTSSSTYMVTAKGYLAPWKTGTVVVSVASATRTGPVLSENVPVKASAVPFDVAARFSTQAAFGPRPDVVANIQQLGLKGWITQQLALPAVVYDPSQTSRTQFERFATSGSSLLRLRVAWALQNFLVSQCIFQSFSCIPYERTLEKDATGNFRTLMTDVASDASMGMFLNLAGNNVPTDPTQHPNQNFARELMQLFTIGPNLLNEDGTLQLDRTGSPIPAYTQAQVEDMSRVFTGWNFPPAVDPAYTGYYGFDYSQPLKGYEVYHDQGAKTILSGVRILANQGVVQDRTVTLDTIFAHPNLPPRIARLLIQHLVKSAPTPGYVQRMARVFENDGTGVRGNLTAVVTAILLDPEARAGDTTMAADDGFLQDPVLFEFFMTSVLQATVTDDQSGFYPGRLGEDFFYAPSVFGFYRPDYVIPGTTINGPEFQIFNNQSAIQRSEYLWGLITNTEPGFTNNSFWLATNFGAVPDLVDALDHLLFHGQMPAAEKTAILSYCQSLPANDPATQWQSALFLAMNSDGYTVSH